MIEGFLSGLVAVAVGWLAFAVVATLASWPLRRLFGVPPRPGKADVPVLLLPWLTWVVLCFFGGHKTFANVVPEMMLLGCTVPFGVLLGLRFRRHAQDRLASIISVASVTVVAVALWVYFPLLRE